MNRKKLFENKTLFLMINEDKRQMLGIKKLFTTKSPLINKNRKSSSLKDMK